MRSGSAVRLPPPHLLRPEDEVAISDPNLEVFRLIVMEPFVVMAFTGACVVLSGKKTAGRS